MLYKTSTKHEHSCWLYKPQKLSQNFIEASES
jgi:hypothetical protein